MKSFMHDLGIVILARNGSKRIVQKNYKKFCGKPLVYWSIETALKLKLPLVILTDIPQALKGKYSKYCKFYPVEISGDKHNMIESIKYANNFIECKNLILLQPTTPIRNPGLIKSWISLFNALQVDCGFSAVKSDKFVYSDDKTCINAFNREKPYNYIENGGFYIFNSEYVDHKHIIYGNKVVFIDNFILDLDTIEQWKEAEYLHKKGYYKYSYNIK